MKGTAAEAIERNIRNYASYFGAGPLVRMERIAGRTLAELGYETQERRGDSDPPRRIVALVIQGSIVVGVFRDLQQDQGRQKKTLVYGSRALQERAPAKKKRSLVTSGAN